MEDYRREAEHFLANEKQFHLGMMPTEQSHPGTRGLAEKLQEDCAAGVRMLQSVDRDVAEMARRVMPAEEMQALIESLAAALASGRRVCFSGCGATGRLSIMLEAMWRKFWRDLAQQRPENADLAAELGGRVISIMTGGDYALIRSVEGFEDYISFGREQVRKADLGAGDVLVAISEGGETSSVIGTLLEATERGLRGFFVFNNPNELLAEHIERSREAIENPDVTVLDLNTGPMAVAGSTRMQATTAELLVVGSALEQALLRLLTQVLPAEAVEALQAQSPGTIDAAAQFDALLDDLGSAEAVAALADWTEIEHELYDEDGLITYYAGECMLDIFTDTTERSPTFMLPPFRRCDDTVSPPSWAFVKDPLRPTPEAWREVLGRAPRCLDWDPARYEALGATGRIVANPPALGCDDLMSFRIGAETDASRTDVEPNLAMAVLLTDELRAPEADRWQAAFARATTKYARRLAVVIGEEAAEVAGAEHTLHIPCRLPSTFLSLYDRLAVKLVLNTVSTATMGRMGRIVSNWMVNVECSNKKLIDRGTRLVAELAGLDYAEACLELHRTIAGQRASAEPEAPRVSPVALTLQRLRKK